MATFPADLVFRPGAEAARRVALAYLEDAARALERLPDPEDREALHDFRVALRRLSSTLRAYRRELAGSVRRRQRRRVREISRVTNRGRDAEVALAWLRPLATDLAAHERVGLRWLAEAIEADRAATIEQDLAKLPRAFSRVARGLGKRLSVYRQEVPVDGTEPPPLFGDVVRASLSDQARQLDESLAEIHRADDLQAMHRARIAAKRLRYQLEPLAEGIPGVAALVDRLKALQDLLGELCDVRSLDELVRQAVAAAGADRARALFDAHLARRTRRATGRIRRRPSYRAGLLAVAARLRGRRTAGFARLRRGSLDGGFVALVEAILQRLTRAPAAIPNPVPPRLPRRARRGQPTA